MQQTRRMVDKGGSGRSSVGSESLPVGASNPDHMRDTINGQRATIAKLFEQGTLTSFPPFLSLYLHGICHRSISTVSCISLFPFDGSNDTSSLFNAASVLHIALVICGTLQLDCIKYFRFWSRRMWMYGYTL